MDEEEEQEEEKNLNVKVSPLKSEIQEEVGYLRSQERKHLCCCGGNLCE